MTDFDPDKYIADDSDGESEYSNASYTCEIIQNAMNDGKEGLAERALRTAVEKGWKEAWFQQSSNVTESERPPLSQRVCEQDFEEWWRMNYE